MKKLSKNRKEKISNIDFSKSYNPVEAIIPPVPDS